MVAVPVHEAAWFDYYTDGQGVVMIPMPYPFVTKSLMLFSEKT